MKRICYILMLVSSFQCFSQATEEPVLVRFDIGKGFFAERVFAVNGSPYLNEKYEMGVIINGPSKKEFRMRYNAYLGMFEVLDKNDKEASVLKSANILVAFDEKIYRILDYEETVQDKALYYLPQNGDKTIRGNIKQGYFNRLSDGETKLYLKTIKRIPKFKSSDHGYNRFEPTALLTLTHYFIKRKYRPATRIKLSKKEVLFALNDKYNELRTYIKKNKLKLKTEEEVIQLISYYDTLN